MGRTAVTGGYDSTIRVWEVITGICQQVLVGHSRKVVVDVCLDEVKICSSSYDCTVRLWDRQFGDCLYVLSSHSFYASAYSLVDIAPSNLITTMFVSGGACVWDPVSGNLIRQIDNLDSYYLGLNRAKEKTLVAREMQNGETDWFKRTLMSVPSPQTSAWEKCRHISIPLPSELDITDSIFLNIACSATHVVLGSENRVYVYSLPALDLVHVLEPGELSYHEPLKVQGEILVISWKETLGIIASTGKRVSISGTEVVEIEENGRAFRQEWPKDLLLVVPMRQYGHTEAQAQTHMLQTYALHGADIESNRQEPSTLLPSTTIYPTHHARSLASRGRTAVTGGYDTTVRAWDLITGECRLVLVGHRTLVTDVDLDNTRIYSSSYDNTVRIWDRSCGDCLHVLNTTSRPSLGLCFLDITPPYLTTTINRFSGNCEIRIWDPISGVVIHQFRNQTDCRPGPIQGRDRTLVTAKVGEDANMISYKVLGVETGQILAEFPILHTERVSLPFCAQDQFLTALVKQGEEYILSVWDFRIDNILDEDLQWTNVKAYSAPTYNILEGELERRSNVDRWLIGFASTLIMMSYPSLPSTWKDPPQLSIPLPTELDGEICHLECTSTRAFVGCSTRVYIYSLPVPQLDHVLECHGVLADYRPLRIYDERYLLVIHTDAATQSPKEGFSLDIWEIPDGKHLGTVRDLSVPVTGLATEAGELVEGLPKPLLIVSSSEGDADAHTGVLRTYDLHHSDIENADEAFEIKRGRPAMLPWTSISPVHIIFCLATRGRTILTGGQDATIRTWDIITGERQLVLMGHTEAVTDVCLDQSRIYSSSRDFATIAHRLLPCFFHSMFMLTPSPPTTWKDPRSLYVHLAFDIDPTRLDLKLHLQCSGDHVVISYKNHLYIYSLPSFDLVRILELGEHQRYCSHQVFGETLVVEYKDAIQNPFESPYLNFWDLSTRKSIGTVFGASAIGGNRCVSCPKSELIQVEENGVLVSQQWPKNRLLLVLSTNDADSEALHVYVLHNEHAGRTNEHTAGSHDPPPLVPATTISPIHRVACLASTGRTALTGGYDGTLRVWDIMSGQCRMVLIGHTKPVIDVAVDESRIYSSSYDVTVRIWDRYHGDSLHVLRLETPAHTTISISPSQLMTIPNILGVFNVNSPICVWDPATGELIYRIEEYSDWALGPMRGEERTLLTLDVDILSYTDTFKIWDLKSGQLLTNLSIGSQQILGTSYIRFSSQDRFLAAVVKRDGQYLLKVWDFGVDGAPREDNDMSGNDVESSVVMEETSGGLADHGRLSSSGSSTDDERGGPESTGKRKRGKGKKVNRRVLRNRHRELKVLATPAVLLSQSPMSTSLSISPWETIRRFSFSLPFAFDADTNHHARLHLACSATRVVLGYKNQVYLYSLPAFDLIDTLEPDEFSTLNSIHILGTIPVVTCDLQSPGHSGEGSCMYIWDLSSGEIIGTIEGCGLSLYVRKSLCHPWAEAATAKQNDKWDRPGTSKHPLFIVSSKVDERFEAKGLGEDYILKTYVLHDTHTEGTDAAVEGRQSPPRILPAMTIRPIHAASCLDSMGRTALTGGRDATYCGQPVALFLYVMTMSSLRSGWANPRQFSIPLPFEPDSEQSTVHLECSQNNMVLGHKGRVYVYSLPAFELLHTMEPGDFSLPTFFKPFRIIGEILVVAYEEGVDSEGLEKYLYTIRHIPSLKVLGSINVDFPSGMHICGFDVGIDGAGAVKDGNPVSKQRPTERLLTFFADGVLQTYALPLEEPHNAENLEEETTLWKPLAACQTPSVICHASMGKTAITGGWDATVRVWDMITAECQLVLIGHTSTVADLYLDTNRIYSTSIDRTARVWDRHSGDCLHVLELPVLPDITWNAVFVSTYLITTTYANGGHSGPLCAWDMTSGSPVLQIDNQMNHCIGSAGHYGPVCVIEDVDKDSGLLGAEIWDIRRGQCLASFPTGRKDSMYLPSWFQDGLSIFVNKKDTQHILTVWDFGANDPPEEDEIVTAHEGPDRTHDTKVTEVSEVRNDLDVLSQTRNPGSSSNGEEPKKGKRKNLIRRLLRRS
ncbi:hypothetical protein CVT26_010440 [Gymnopilus dilepis]|uniref:Uncharacterized protein n=1 Tax=Gymnopilus dilepis TaxID=231916 RepID=A0A409Y0I9_9AGAR|nr:hypothetical protein CVT26_010440 [Gymnopilus dilepis]